MSGTGRGAAEEATARVEEAAGGQAQERDRDFKTT